MLQSYEGLYPSPLYSLTSQEPQGSGTLWLIRPAQSCPGPAGTAGIRAQAS